MKIIPLESFELAEKLLVLAQNKTAKLESGANLFSDKAEILKLILQAKQLLNSNDN